jgi:hypothetical protein
MLVLGLLQISLAAKVQRMEGQVVDNGSIFFECRKSEHLFPLKRELY